MWLLEILELHEAYLIFLVDNTALHPLYIVELGSCLLSCVLYICQTENMRNRQYYIFEYKVLVLDFEVREACVLVIGHGQLTLRLTFSCKVKIVTILILPGYYQK